MTSKLCALVRGVLLGGTLGTLAAAAEPSQVRVQLSAPAEYSALLARLGAELRSEGFEPEVLASAAALPCEPRSNAAEAGPADARRVPASHVATILIHAESAVGELVAELCYVPPPTAPEQARVRASANEPARFALAVVEALNGLTAPLRAGAAAADRGSSGAPGPTARAAPGGPLRAQSRASEAELVPAHVSGFASAVLALQTAGQPLFGVNVGVDVPLHRRLALELEVFAPLRAIRVAGDDRDLAVRSAWARAGLRPSWLWLGSSVGLSLHAGVALVWATATTREPLLIGTTELTAAAILSGGAWFEAPRDSQLYFRAASHVSRLLPSTDVVLGGASARAFGELSVELAAGVGVRWSGE